VRIGVCVGVSGSGVGVRLCVRSDTTAVPRSPGSKKMEGNSYLLPRVGSRVAAPRAHQEAHRQLAPHRGQAPLLTPKIGTTKRLTCGPSLVRGHHSAGSFL
jgi:hypothetical protein